jgi:hypothetical protein
MSAFAKKCMMTLSLAAAAFLGVAATPGSASACLECNGSFFPGFHCDVTNAGVGGWTTCTPISTGCRVSGNCVSFADP